MARSASKSPALNPAITASGMPPPATYDRPQQDKARQVAQSGTREQALRALDDARRGSFGFTYPRSTATPPPQYSSKPDALLASIREEKKDTARGRS